MKTLNAKTPKPSRQFRFDSHDSYRTIDLDANVSSIRRMAHLEDETDTHLCWVRAGSACTFSLFNVINFIPFDLWCAQFIRVTDDFFG
jgi:hypothetical protein